MKMDEITREVLKKVGCSDNAIDTVEEKGLVFAKCHFPNTKDGTVISAKEALEILGKGRFLDAVCSDSPWSLRSGTELGFAITVIHGLQNDFQPGQVVNLEELVQTAIYHYKTEEMERE